MKFKTLRELRSKIILKYTMLFDAISKDTSNDIKTDKLLRKAFLDTCIAKENLNQLYGWYLHFSKVYKNYIGDWEDCKYGDDDYYMYMKEEDVLEEIKFLYDNFYITPELIQYVNTIIESEKMIEEAFFGFFGEPKYLINKDGKVVDADKNDLELLEIKKEEKNINLKYCISEWDEYYKIEFDKIIKQNKIDKIVIENFLSL